VIERLLAAEAALERDELDAAERLFGQVAEADPRNAIAAVGGGWVAAGRPAAPAARTWFLRALEIDPEEAAARRLLAALDREMAPVPGSLPAQVPGPPQRPAEAPRLEPEPAPAAAPHQPAAPKRRSLLDRIRAWLGPSRPSG
jgi:hypothetical protein